MGDKKKGPKPAPPPTPVSYRKEKAREEEVGGISRRSLGAKYMQTRKATPTGSGMFGGQKQTLG